MNMNYNKYPTNFNRLKKISPLNNKREKTIKNYLIFIRHKKVRYNPKMHI